MTIEESSQVRILSYNIYVRPFVYSNKGDFKDERLEILLNEHFGNYDILALQEIFAFGHKNRKNFVIHESKKHGLVHYATIGGSWLNLKPIDSGLLVLSRYPIVEYDKIIFSKGTSIDGWSTKGALSALIQIPCKKTSQNDQDNDTSSTITEILVFNTHTQAEYDQNDPSYWEIQQSQVQELKEFIKKKHAQYPHVPMILCGDLNINARANPESDGVESSHNYNRMMEILSFDDNSEHVQWKDIVYEKLGHHPITFADTIVDNGKHVPKDYVLTNKATLGQRLRLDYIFLYQRNEDISVLETKVEPYFVNKQEFGQLSDHYAVTATLGLNSIHEKMSKQESVQ
jgi:endonuclease/exonuclease/phosphatase family metal-dependent hydrolase